VEEKDYAGFLILKLVVTTTLKLRIKMKRS